MELQAAVVRTRHQEMLCLGHFGVRLLSSDREHK